MSKKDADGQNFLTDTADAGQRIDKFLSDNLKDVSRSRLQKLIGEGKVLVGGNRISKHYRLLDGDRIEISELATEPAHSDIKPEAVELNIIYEENGRASCRERV